MRWPPTGLTKSVMESDNQEWKKTDGCIKPKRIESITHLTLAYPAY